MIRSAMFIVLRLSFTAIAVYCAFNFGRDVACHGWEKAMTPWWKILLFYGAAWIVALTLTTAIWRHP